nr:MAG TPA: hypothetical protein [Bacteriophage sp.]
MCDNAILLRRRLPLKVDVWQYNVLINNVLCGFIALKTCCRPTFVLSAF